MQSKEAFEFCDKGSSLILSAPHATRSVLNGKERISDKYTGALVRLLGEQNNLSTLIRVKCSQEEETIAAYVSQKSLQNHYFLDIHGFDKDIGQDICLGIGKLFEQKNVPFLNRLLEIAEKFGIKTVVNHPKYVGAHGFAGQYQALFHAPNVIQVELGPSLRNFYDCFSTVEKITIPFFNEVIACYQKHACPDKDFLNKRLFFEKQTLV